VEDSLDSGEYSEEYLYLRKEKVKMPYQYPFINADENLINAVWQKGRIITNYNKDIRRWDICGKIMKYSEHGNTSSDYGWEIDHIYPKALGGNDKLENLQPLHWKNNRDKGDSLNWKCP
jgi:5-methylcytosine-specific restriction endonuclease McrA